MLSASTRTTTPQNQGFVLKSQRSFTASKIPIRQTQTPRPKSCFPTCMKMKKTGSSANPIIAPLQSVGFCGSGFSVCSNISSNQSIDRILYGGRSWKIGSLGGWLANRTRSRLEARLGPLRHRKVVGDELPVILPAPTSPAIDASCFWEIRKQSLHHERQIDGDIVGT